MCLHTCPGAEGNLCILNRKIYLIFDALRRSISLFQKAWLPVLPSKTDWVLSKNVTNKSCHVCLSDKTCHHEILYVTRSAMGNIKTTKLE